MAVVLKVIILLLAVVLAAVLIVLFWPVRYHLDGRLAGTGGSAEGFLRARAGLFFGLVRAACDYPEHPEFTVKVLCFTVFRSGGKKKEPEEEGNTEEKPEKSLADRIKQGCDTIRKISGRGAAAREILESRSGGRAWRKGKRKALKVLRAVLPERYRIAGNAGLGDPAATGTLMMAQSVLYPWTGERLLVLPDFESEEITLDITGEGRGAFMIATVLFGFLALYLDKDVRFVWERLKREVLNGGES